jgi:3-hydroxyisobutyrate dehydrogenase-like beta-hydroxyacid dehydrogenase
MGLPMAKHLSEAGYPVTVWNRGAAKAEAAKSFGAKIAKTPREAAAGARFVITMVTDPAAIRSVMEGPDGFLSSEGKTVWMQMSTIDISSTKDFAAAAKKKGWDYLDCPVTGSKKQVEAAQLILLAGGDAKVLEEARPLLMKMGKTVVHAGGVGAGSALKLCMNLIVAQMTTALVESAALAQTTGIDPAKIFEVLKNSPALDCGYYRIKEEAILKKNFSPAFSLANMLKDVRFMTAESGSRGLKLSVTQSVQNVMEEALAKGFGEEDLFAIAKVVAKNGG